MKISDRFDVSFKNIFIIFESKSDGTCVDIQMGNPKTDLERMKDFAEREISKIHITFGTQSSSLQFYRNFIRDCEFLLEHIEEVNNLIIKHQL